MPSRPLRTEEKALIVKLLEKSPARAKLLAKLDSAEVEDMHDGGMGSVLFRSSNRGDRGTASEAASGTFKDADGVQVVASVNVDQFGDLFELDLWKVDFTPLLRYPPANEVTLELRSG